MAMTLMTDQILQDLHTGNAEIRFKEYSENDWKGGTIDFSAASVIYTAKDTLEVNQEQPTVTELKLDQNDRTYSSTSEAGAFTFAGLIPSVAEAVFDNFMNKYANEEGTSPEFSVKLSATETMTGRGYETGVKKIEGTILLVSESRKSAIVLGKVELYGAFTGASADAGAGVNMAGTVVANPNGPDIIVLKAPAA